MPHFYRSPDEFLAAAESAVAGAAPRRPVAVLAGEVDPAPAGVATGRATPDSRLGAVADVVRQTLRADDHVGRFGNRLVMVLPGATGEDARCVGERLCAALRMHALADGPGHLTLSVGAASAPEHGTSYSAALLAATAAMARVQAQGRDGAVAAPLPHHEALHRPLSIDRLAGRVQELASLTRWLDEACDGQPRVVTVIGETGTGTGMLLRQLESEVRLRGGLFVMAASPHVDIPPPLGVWSALLRGMERFLNGSSHEWHELQHLEPTLGEPTNTAESTGSQYRLFSELAEYVRAAAAERPLVMVLDEMQWADAASWDALEHLLGRLGSDRLMICIAHRLESTHETAAQRTMVRQHEMSRELTLSRLTRDEVKQWLEAAFHWQQVGREFLAFLYRHTEGRPLFIAQLLRSLMEDGAIWHNGSRWEWSPVSELRPPADYRALIAQRLSKFSSSTQAVLATAAIVGSEFDVGLLAAAGAGSEAAVRLAIIEAVQSGLLRRTYERKRGGHVFVHDAIAEMVVEGIPRDRVRQLHQRAARAIEKRRPDRAGEVALHFDAAGESAEAYKWAQVAAAAADRVYAHAAAGAYRQMAARNATSPAELAEIRVALARAAETGGRHDEVEELCDLAIDWFDAQGDERRALSLRCMREQARLEQGQPAHLALDALSALNEEAKRLGADAERVAILTMESRAAGRIGESRRAERIAVECVELAESVGDSALLANALTRLAITFLTEAPARAMEAHQRALELFNALGDVRGQARAQINIGSAAQFEGRLDEASRAYENSLSIARSAGIPDLWGVSALNVGILSQRMGDYDRARDLFSEALGLFAAVKHSEFQLIALYNMAHVERELGLPDSAVGLFDATVPLAQRIGQSDIEAGALAGAGLCHLAMNRLDAARANLAEVRRRLETRPDWFQGREVVEAFIVRMDLLDGADKAATERFQQAVPLAEAADFYTAAWLTAECAGPLMSVDSARMKPLIARYTARVRTLGFPEMTKRYETLAVA